MSGRVAGKSALTTVHVHGPLRTPGVGVTLNGDREHGTGGAGGWHTDLTQRKQSLAFLRKGLQHPPHVLQAGRSGAHLHCFGVGAGAGVGGGGGGEAGHAARKLHSPVAAHHPHCSPLAPVR